MIFLVYCLYYPQRELRLILEHQNRLTTKERKQQQRQQRREQLQQLCDERRKTTLHPLLLQKINRITSSQHR